MNPEQAARHAATLECWSRAVEPQPVGGGISNANFRVTDRGRDFFVRIAEDCPEHGVLRHNEIAASRAAHAAGISPEVVYAAPGALVIGFVDGVTLTPQAVREAHQRTRIVEFVRHAHRTIPRHLRGPAITFWVFHSIRDYRARLVEEDSRMAGELPRLLDTAARLERAVGAVQLVFGHNDLLAANLIDDGTRLWLIDWEYGGFNSPLFDLANLASNNELDPTAEREMLARYFDREPDAALWHGYQAMKCASLLREAMWSMVSELHSTLDIDYVAYTTENLARFERAMEAFDDQ